MPVRKSNTVMKMPTGNMLSKTITKKVKPKMLFTGIEEYKQNICISNRWRYKYMSKINPQAVLTVSSMKKGLWLYL